MPSNEAGTQTSILGEHQSSISAEQDRQTHTRDAANTIGCICALDAGLRTSECSYGRTVHYRGFWEWGVYYGEGGTI